MINRFTAPEQALLRQKVLAYTIFKDKKPYQLLRKYEADYLSKPTNSHANKFKEAVQLLFKQFGDSQILFADEVVKMNRSGGADTRVIIVTESNIYKCDPKSYKVKKYDGSVKGGAPVAEISAVSLSPLADNFVVVHTREGMRDLVMGIGAPGVDKLSEFVTIIAGLHKQITQKALPVTFSTNIQYNNSSKLGEKSTLTFEVDPKVHKSEFKKSKTGGVVHIPK